MSPPRKPRSRLRFSLTRAALLLGLAAAIALPGTATALPADASNVLVVEDDGSILEPARPLPLAGQTVRIVRDPSGGYRSATGTFTTDPEGWRSGNRVVFAGSATSARVSLPFSFRFFDGSYDEIFIHPQGAVTLGRPLPSASRAQATSSGDLLRSLMAGPPLVAGLWNELFPSRAPANGGVFIEQRADRVSIAWVAVPSARPADEANTFRITLHPDGSVDLEYAAMASRWGIVGLAPGRDAERVDLVDFAAAPRAGARDALLAWYRDLPELNEMALTRAVYRRVPDRFQFLTVFTTQPVDGPSLIGSMPVKNSDRGIGLPVFDHGPLFGSHNLEHVVVMNDLAFYDDDPARPPRHPSYAFAPSTLAVLAHEAGHRWLAEASCSLGSLGSKEGHWSFFLDSGGSFLGGTRLRDNADGTFTTQGALSGFGELDQYLMGLRPPQDVAPFSIIQDATDFQPPHASNGQPFDLQTKPENGVRFRGTRHAITIDDVIRATGERAPAAGHGPRAFRMAFVLVVPAGTRPTEAELAKVESVRRGFGPFFQDATGARARMATTLPRALPAASPQDDPRLRAGEPRVLDAEVRPRGVGRVALKLEFADFDGDLTGVEVSTDATASAPP